jgi:serine phosphatase RsbU (regulator of sigma subunit)
MTAEENESFVSRWDEAFLRHDAVAFAEEYAADCVVESPIYGPLIGRAAVLKAQSDYFAAFPDTTILSRDFFSTGDRLLYSTIVFGTDTGGFLGQAPTGRHVRAFFVRLITFSERQIVHERRVYDLNGLLLQLATRVGVAADTAALYRATLERARLEHELGIAAEIQRALLPQGQHEGPGFELAASSKPCRAIGGDFFDYFDLPNGSFGFVLGDVAGKGPPAALLAAKLQGMVASYADSVVTPAATVTRVNRELVRRSVDSRFATLLYGVLTPDGRLTYCNAGHNPPFVVGRRGVRRLDKGGLIIGAFKEITFYEETVQLDPGDVLIVFSDGVTEALSVDDLEFGEDRLLGCADAHREATAAVLLDSLIQAVRAFTVGAEQSDDLTALVLRYSG